MTVLATIVVLGVLIFVHELGHFAAAKAVGIEVQRFSIGLGPKVFGFTRGETEYVISAIPLGGYVKMGGMDDEVMETIEGGRVDGPKREPSDRDFDAKPIWARTVVISAGVIMNMIFAFGVYTSLAATRGVELPQEARLGIVLPEGLPVGTTPLARLAPGTRFVAVGDEPVETWLDLQNALYTAAPGPLSIQLADPDGSIEIEVPASEEDRVEMVRSMGVWIDAAVGRTVPGGPADVAGIRDGDRVLSVDGVPTPTWYQLVEEIRARPGAEVQVRIEREGSEQDVVVALEAAEEGQPQGPPIPVGRAGIEQPSRYESGSIGAAVASGWSQTVAVTGSILFFLRELFTGGIPATSVGSIVTIGQASGQAAAMGLDRFLEFMAFFSVNLAVLNLLPIPVLDGGHLVFLGIEAVRGGRALSVEQRLRWSNVGFIIIVGIMIFALSNDFVRILTR